MKFHILGLYLVDNPWEVATKHYSTLGALFVLAFLLLYLGGAAILGRDVNPIFVTFSVFAFIILSLIGKFTRQTDQWKKTRRTLLTVFLSVIFSHAGWDLAYGKAEMPTYADLFYAEKAGFQAASVDLITGWEGKHMGDGITCARHLHQGYLDIVDVPTIGYGHTLTAVEGDCITEREARDLLYGDIQSHWVPVWNQFTPTAKQNMAVLRKVSMASLCYNIGVGACKRSTANRRFNRGDMRGGCKAMTRWNRAGGQVVWGLVRRRTAEYEYCMWGLS